MKYRYNVCRDQAYDRVNIKFACESVFKTMLKKKSDYIKKWETLAEFGNPIEQYNAIQFSEMISTKEQVDYLLRLKLIESLNVENDNLRVKLKDKNEILLKLDD